MEGTTTYTEKQESPDREEGRQKSSLYQDHHWVSTGTSLMSVFVTEVRVGTTGEGPVLSEDCDDEDVHLLGL